MSKQHRFWWPQQRDEVNTPHILVITGTFDKNGVQIIVNIFLKLFIVFMSTFPNRYLDEFELRESHGH